jgi:diguanylate cyclase (GGDEF)-like protein/PAS domain S-box-containing protein
MERPTLKTLLHCLALAALIFAIASASIALTRFDRGAAFIWPATAPLLAFLVVRPRRAWLAPLFAAGVAFWLASTTFGLGPVTGIPLTIALLGEALIAAMILRVAGSDFTSLDSMQALGLFTIATGIIAPALSGVPAALAIAAKTGQTFWPNWCAWFAAHSLGTTSFAPLLLLLSDGQGRLWLRKASSLRKLEGAAHLGAVAATTFGVFYQERAPILFLPLLPILLATFRMGRLGATCSIVLLATVGGALTLLGHGPVSLMHATAGQRAQFFQFYLAVAVMMVLPAAAELKRRNALTLRAMRSEASYRLLADNLGDTMIHTSLTGDVRFASPAIRELTGFDAADVIGRNSRDFVIPEDLTAFEAARATAIADSDRTISIDYRARIKGATVIWCETRMRSYVDAEGIPTGVILVVRNASLRKAAEAELSFEAKTDELTGLPNRRAFFSRLDHVRGEVSSGRGTGCVALLDVDFFKRVNDVHGHATGDVVLRTVADAIRNALRSGDMVARVGGEEFGLVFWGTTIEQAAATCERVREAIASCSARSSSGVHVIVTASLGLTAIEPRSTSSEMYERADRLLYEAKSAGRNRVLAAA